MRGDIHRQATKKEPIVVFLQDQNSLHRRGAIGGVELVLRGLGQEDYLISGFRDYRGGYGGEFKVECLREISEYIVGDRLFRLTVGGLLLR